MIYDDDDGPNTETTNKINQGLLTLMMAGWTSLVSLIFVVIPLSLIN
jgi:hypothetical protein